MNTITSLGAESVEIMSEEQAITIIKQMGTSPNKIKVMLGGLLILVDNGLIITFKGCRKYNRCEIKLNSKDLYDLKFYQTKNFEQVGLGLQYDDVYWDDLRKLFENTTGLYVSL